MIKNRVGKVQRGVRRAFIASDGAPLLTRDLLKWTCPREDWYPQARYRSLARAATRFAVKLGRCGKGNLWAPRPELLALIKGESGER